MDNNLLETVQNILSTVLIGVLVAAVPVLVLEARKAVISWYTKVRLDASDSQRKALDQVASLAVAAVEQYKLRGAVSDALKTAERIVEDKMAQLGYPAVDVGVIRDALEGALWQDVNSMNPEKNPALQAMFVDDNAAG